VDNQRENRVDPQPLKDEQFKSALFRLAQFDPTVQDCQGSHAVDYITLHALACFGMMPAKPAEVSKAIHDIFGIRFEPAEVEGAARRLETKGLASVEDTGRHMPVLLRITPGAAGDVDKSLAEMQNLESRVMTEWKECLKAQYRDVPEIAGDIDHIERCLQMFTARMLAKHGIQCTVLLYPEELKSQTWLDAIKQDIMADLPKVSTLIDAAVLIEVPAFFRSTDPSRVKYVNSLLNSSYFWHMIQVDDTCSRLLTRVTTHQELYLDVNVLYSLSGLHGEHMLSAAHSAVSLAKNVGYVLAVTTKSIDEFQSSLTSRQRQYQGRLTVPRELVSLVINKLDDEDYVTSYWKELARSGASIEEFVGEKAHLEGLLDGLNISTTSAFRDEIEASKELPEQESILRVACSGNLADHIVHHDAFHRLFVLKRRGGPKYHLSDAVAWFITHDTKLPAYDREARTRSGQLSSLPFCMTSNEWVQVNRPLLPRTKDKAEFEESFYRLVTQPFIRSIVQRFSLTSAYQEVLGRAARYRNMSPQLALALATDRRLVILTGVETDVEKADQIVESKFVEEATRLSGEKSKLELRAKEDAEERRRVQADFDQFKASSERRIETLTEDVQTLKSDLKHTGEQYGDVSAKAVRAHRLVRVGLWVIFGLAVLIMSGVIWLQPHVVSWAWLATHRCQVFIRIVAQLLIVFALLNVPLHRHWKVWLPLTGTAALALLALAASSA
jgi:hypothetical protein